MMSSNPKYVKSRGSYMKRIATVCRICGNQLLDPADSKQEMHQKCKNGFKKTTYGVK